MSINEVLQIMKQKFNYDDQTLEYLRPIIEGMILYYGEENTNRVYEIFTNVPFAFVNNINEVNKTLVELGIKKDTKLPLYASGGYAQDFYIDDGEIKTKAAIVIDLSKNNGEDKTYQTVVHEFCHAYFGYNRFRVDGNLLIATVGVLRDIYKIDEGLKSSKSIYTQVEEGMNDYDAVQIARYKYPNVKGSAVYNINSSYVSALMDNEIIRKKLNTSRVNGDDAWKEILGEEMSNEFMDAFENYYASFFRRFDLSDEERKQFKEEAGIRADKALAQVREAVRNMDLSQLENPKVSL